MNIDKKKWNERLQASVEESWQPDMKHLELATQKGLKLPERYYTPQNPRQASI